MPQTNILIGIGGTGAKVIESTLMLFSAGIGPDEVYVGLIDQDNANGNANRAVTRLQTMVEVGDRWRAGSTPNSFISRPYDKVGEDAIALNGVKVKPLFANGKAIWAPREDGASLAAILGRNLDPDRQALFDLLFSPDQEEQQFPLTRGYRGRAHVGAAAMMAAMLDDSPLFDRMKELMQGGGDNHEVRIFIAGSAFGGTGAAGFPTFARELHRLRQDPEINFVGRIGGVLMLPYFSFRNTPEGPAGSASVPGLPTVTTDELMPKAQLATEFYANLFDVERTFDRFYTIGWDHFFPLGYHADGADQQRNPPLLPELVTAAAITQFFVEGKGGEGAAQGPVPVFTSSRKQGEFSWTDLPLPEAASESLAQLVRFAVYWRYWIHPALRQKRTLIGGLSEKWMRTLGIPADVQPHLVDERALDRYLDQVLVWAAGLQRWSQQSWGRGLWSVADYLNPLQPERANQDAVLAEPGQARDGDVMFDDRGQPVARGFAAAYADLAANAVNLGYGDHKGYGDAVAAVWRAMRLDD